MSTVPLLDTLSYMMDLYEKKLSEPTTIRDRLTVSAPCITPTYPFRLALIHPDAWSRIQRLKAMPDLFQHLINAIPLTRDPITDDQINANAALVEKALALIP
jgi:hypothetical protein